MNQNEPSNKTSLYPRGAPPISDSLVFLTWTILVALAGIWQYTQIQGNTLQFARHDARAAFNKDVTYRHWASNHGGLYAPITEQTPPNPYLKNIPERDITTPSGRNLTLINPAYMTRQVHELEKDFYGTKGHITSLKPIRPQNAPDDWERKALQTFNNIQDEYSSLEIMDGIEYLRLMRPLLTKKTCLKCHAEQGYELGDIRGGISVAIPMAPLRAVAARHIANMTIGYTLLWTIGSIIILYSFRRIRSQLQKLKNAKQEAETSNASKSRLLAVISHDIRAPLVSISGLTSVLQEEDITPDEQKEYTKALKAATGNMMNLVDDILDISRLEAGKLVVEMGKWPLKEICTELCSIFKTLAEQKKLEFRFNMADDAPKIIYTDSRRLKQCLSNLIYNAIKFTQAGYIALEVDTHLSDEKQWLRFKVEDSGLGIPLEKQAHIFQAFSQINDDNSPKPFGTGLGLAITKQLVELLNGKISLISQFGKGSAFTIYLPIEQKK